MTDLAVLIAGASSSYLEISKKMLQFHYQNCSVDFAYSGADCIEKAATRPYNLILFDYDLGDITGLEIIDRLQATTSGALIILIDEGDEAKAIQAIDRGASDYVLKVRGYLTALPFTLRKFLKQRSLVAPEVEAYAEVSQPQPAASIAPYFLLDRRGRILAANHDIQHATDFSEDELLELSFSDLLPEEREGPFYAWLERIANNGKSGKTFQTEVVNKHGNRVYLEVLLTAVKDENQNVVSYRGRLSEKSGIDSGAPLVNQSIDQLQMVRQISQVITSCYDEPLNVFLQRFAELVCQVFRFERSTIALLDKRKKVFVKQAMVGYSSFPVSEGQRIEVPQEVIDSVFGNRFKVKVIYHNQDHRSPAESLNSKFPERRTQKRRLSCDWHARDLVLANLTNQDGQTFGYISLDRPETSHYPTRDTFHNFEIFGQLVSFAIENYYQISTLEKRSRRLKQVLVTSNIFKLHLSLNDLLNEVVWSIKFSLNFNLVALGLISKRSGHLELKAIACKDKIKSSQLSDVRIPLNQLNDLLRADYSCGRAYFVRREEEVLKPFKGVYYGARLSETNDGRWPVCGLLLVPIKSKDGKIVGLLMADDPADGHVPTQEDIRILEIMANQISVAIDNRILYVKSKKRSENHHRNGNTEKRARVSSNPRLKAKFVDRFFK